MHTVSDSSDSHWLPYVQIGAVDREILAAVQQQSSTGSRARWVLRSAQETGCPDLWQAITCSCLPILPAEGSIKEDADAAAAASYNMPACIVAFPNLSIAHEFILASAMHHDACHMHACMWDLAGIGMHGTCCMRA